MGLLTALTEWALSIAENVVGMEIMTEYSFLPLIGLRSFLEKTWNNVNDL